ncbi:MAG: hypothetical protein ACHQF4_02305 [Sphingobacteriales bacterium]
MLSNEIKAKIFSLYFYQRVFRDIRFPDSVFIINNTAIGLTIEGEYPNDYLLLRSVKQPMPDKHIIEVAKLMGIYEPEYKYSISYYRDVIRDYFNGGITHCWHPFKHQSIIEYLRAESYATPITLLVDGAVRTIGVEEQIESGIIVLDGTR